MTNLSLDQTLAPAQPPSECPACGCTNKTIYETDIFFECHNWWYGHTRKFSEDCCEAYTLTTALRATVATLTAELEARVNRAVCVWCGTETTKAEIAEHIYDCIKSPLGELARTWTAEKDALTARLDAVTGERDDLKAERGVILNGYAMIANYALPYFKKLDKKNPTHDTAELLSACYGALEKRTEETNKLSVEWMNNMQAELTTLRAQVAELRDAAEHALPFIGDGTLLKSNHTERHVAYAELRAALAPGGGVGE